MLYWISGNVFSDFQKAGLENVLFSAIYILDIQVACRF